MSGNQREDDRPESSCPGSTNRRPGREGNIPPLHKESPRARAVVSGAFARFAAHCTCFEVGDT
jgi:hypothetical protein